jgi:hypothetical protein
MILRPTVAPPAEGDIRGLRFVGANRRPDRSSSRWPLNQGISILGRRDRRHYRFKPGQCIVNSNFTDGFRQGLCTQKELDDLKMLVVEVGIEKITKWESYRLLCYSTTGGDDTPGNQIAQWWLKTVVESNFEPCDHPAI